MDRTDRRPCSVSVLACQPMTNTPLTPPAAPAATGPQLAIGPAGQIHWAGLSRTLGRYALGLTRSHHEAEDLVQEALAKLLDRNESAEPIKAVETYAIRTVTRLWLTRQRSLGRRARRLARLASEGVRLSQPSSDGIERSELLDHLDRAIALLPPRQRAALVLRTVEGLGYEAIATALECSVPAARASLHLARKRLARLLGEEGIER